MIIDPKIDFAQRAHRGAEFEAGSDGSSAPKLRAEMDIELAAAVLAIRDNELVVLLTKSGKDIRGIPACLPGIPLTTASTDALGNGFTDALAHRTGLVLGHVEQIATFINQSRQLSDPPAAIPSILIGYLALVRPSDAAAPGFGDWRKIYDFLPWEDWRNGRPAILTDVIEPQLLEWSRRPDKAIGTSQPDTRADRIGLLFMPDGPGWDEERVLERYELLYDAGIVEPRPAGADAAKSGGTQHSIGSALAGDHRRILAAALGRIRATIKYRPLIFDLMEREFTLFELQRSVEAVLGPHLHKQNFRRLVEGGGLVEATGDVRAKTGGRPAKLFRFRREVIMERAAPGVRIRPGRV